jgi:tetratricopeptide (TPR) repeat protein
VDLSSEDDPMHWNGLSWLATVLRELGRLPEARATFERVVAAPQVPAEDRKDALDELGNVKVLIAELLYDRREFAACIEECRALLPQMCPGSRAHASLVLFLGHSYLGVRNLAAARKCYETVVAMLNPGDNAIAIARAAIEKLR